MIISILICCFINGHFLFTHSVTLVKYEPINKSGEQNEILTSTIYSQSNNYHAHELSNLTEKISIDEKPDTHGGFIIRNSDPEEELKHQGQNGEQYEAICIDVIWQSFYEKYWFYIDATIYSFLPSILLTIFNISIIRYLFKAADESLKLKQYQIRRSRFVSTNTTQFNNPTTSNIGTPSSLPGGYGSLRSSLNARYISSNNHHHHPSHQNNHYLNEYSQLNDFKRSSMVSTMSRPKDSIDLQRPGYLSRNTSTAFLICNNSNQRLQTNTIIHEYESRIEGSGGYSSAILPTVNVNTSSGVANHHNSTSSSGTVKRFNTRITVMLIALNVTFCIFSMPMVILQIVFFSISPLLDSQTHTSSAPEATTSNYLTSFSPMNATTAFRYLTKKETVTDIHIEDELLNRIDLMKAIAEILQYLNHSSNFFYTLLVVKHFEMKQNCFFYII